MCTPNKTSRHLGFVLIEALIALVLISIGLVAVAKLQVLSMSGAGEAKARSEAMAVTQKKLEELRNILVKTQYTTDPLVTGSATQAGANATYTINWTAAAIVVGTAEQRLLQLTTSWSDRTGAQSLNLATLIAWDDPGAQAKLSSPPNVQLITPTGSARRGTGNLGNVGIANPDGSKLYTDGTSTTYLLKANGDVLLYLPPKGTTAQAFATISGRIYFDQGSGNAIPNPQNVRVRLSSEGECIYNNSNGNVVGNGDVVGGSNTYRYFDYTCYVGPGWYGNVGVIVDDSVVGGAGDPTICVGDPTYNGGLSDNTLISPNAAVSATRSYRGFRGSSGAYFSTGMEGGSHYGTTTNLTGPFAGLPKPSSYHNAFYTSVATGSTTDYFDQNFLLTNISGQQTCAQKMTGGTVFTRNAGKYFCINPDNETGTADACPAIWPNFENQVGSGTGMVMTIVPAGTGTGTVTSAPAGIDCGAACVYSFTSGASVTLTAAPTNGSTFTGWSGGGCSGTASCTVTMSAATSITATFAAAVTNHTLTVSTTGGSGSGTVSSAPAGISCSPTCSASFATGTSVTLSAAPASGSTFSGWSGGGCSGTGTCTVVLSADASVTATFNTAPLLSITVTPAGAGTGMVTSSPGGISCGTTCSATYLLLESVTLTATPTGGSSFTGWSGGNAGCSGTGTCVVSVTGAMSVTATFAAPLPSYTLTVAKAGVGTGTVTSSPSGIDCGSTCSASYTSGTTVTLTAVAGSGGFTGWTGACTGTGACVVSMNAAKSVTATFGACNTPISGSAADKNGIVTVAPTSAGSCTMQGGNSVGYNCTITAAAGTSITLTNSYTTGQTLHYSYPKATVANCSAQTINFP